MSARTILLVEDSPDDVALTEAAMQRLGSPHRLAVATDGEEALEYLRSTEHAMPDLVLLDLKLPGLDGFEVLRRMRAGGRAVMVPVVILTSSIEETDVQASYSLGANSYIRKPTDFDQFVPVLAELVHYWLVLNQAPSGAGQT